MGWGSGSFSGGSWISLPFRRGAVRNRHRATQSSSIVDVSWSCLPPYLQDPTPSGGFVSNWTQDLVASQSVVGIRDRVGLYPMVDKLCQIAWSHVTPSILASR
jgi:hypothetical protein